MNAELLLAHFNRLSEAPDAVPRLRRFVLDLAVRGKLVEQDPKDEPAAKVLDRIEERRAQLGIAKDPHGIIDDDEAPFKIPVNWVWARLGYLCSKTGSGSTPRGGKSAYHRTGVAFLRSQNVHNDGLRLDDVAYISHETHQKMSGTAVQQGDLLLNITGGSIGRCCLVPKAFPQANVSQHVAIIRTAIDGIQCYLHQLVLSRYFQSFILSEQTGAGRGGLPKNRMDRIPVALPPAAEQQRIVAKVHELMALCERLETMQRERETRRNRLTAASHKHLNDGADAVAIRNRTHFFIGHLPQLCHLPEQISHLRRTIFNLAVRGLLCPQNDSDKSAADMLRTVHPSSWSNSAGNRGDLPAGWESVSISELLIEDSRNGYSKKPDDAKGGVPILRINAGTARRDGIVAEEEYKFIGNVPRKLQELYLLRPGDLLACRFNGNKSFVGRLSLYKGYLGIRHIYPDKLIRLRLIPELMVPELLRYFAESSIVRKEVELYCATTVGNWGISATNFKTVRVPLPPLAEQHRIVAKIEELMALCDQLEAQLGVAQTESSRLMESVLHRCIEDTKAGTALATALFATQ